MYNYYYLNKFIIKMVQFIISLLLFLTTLSNAQLEMKITDCYKKKGYYFCNKNDNSLPQKRTSRNRREKQPPDTYGYCCPLALAEGTDEKCLQNSETGHECTLPVEDPKD